MNELSIHQREINSEGFTILENIYSTEELNQIINIIDNTDSLRPTFRKSAELFAIRQFLKEVPEVCDVVFNNNLKFIIQELFGSNYFVVKSIYFDKPETSNWFVPYHQDLTISVDKKVELKNYGPWTIKQNQFAVQPPMEILENIFTIRIHLDYTDENNGALKVVPRSHLKGTYRPETIDWNTESETICNVPAGGVMIMKPLILHGSNKTINNKKRRVIHIEFSNMELPRELDWPEKLNW